MTICSGVPCMTLQFLPPYILNKTYNHFSVYLFCKPLGIRFSIYFTKEWPHEQDTVPAVNKSDIIPAHVRHNASYDIALNCTTDWTLNWANRFKTYVSVHKFPSKNISGSRGLRQRAGRSSALEPPCSQEVAAREAGARRRVGGRRQDCCSGGGADSRLPGCGAAAALQRQTAG